MNFPHHPDCATAADGAPGTPGVYGVSNTIRHRFLRPRAGPMLREESSYTGRSTKIGVAVTSPASKVNPCPPLLSSDFNNSETAKAVAAE